MTGNGRETSETEHQVSKTHPVEIQTEERVKENRTAESYRMRPNYLKYTLLESEEENERVKGKRRGVERRSSRGRRREAGRQEDRGRIAEKRYLKR